METDNMSPQPNIEKVYERLDSHEKSITRIETTLEAFIDQSHKDLSKLADAVESMVGNSRTNWSTLAAWAAVIVAIIGGYTTLTAQATTARIDMQQKIDEMRAGYIEERLDNQEAQAIRWRDATELDIRAITTRLRLLEAYPLPTQRSSSGNHWSSSGNH